MQLRSATSTLAIITLAASSGAIAESRQLSTVTVTESFEETLSHELSHYGSRVEVITRDEIEETGAQDVSQALQMLVPGLYIAPKHGRFDYVDASLQGSRSRDILWLVDGVRINNRLFGGTSPLDSIPAHMVERIEVLKGGQSLFYGTQALGGVVNVITHGFRDEPEGQVGLGVGTLEERQVDGMVRDNIGGNRVVLFGSHAQAGGFTPFPDDQIEPSAKGGGTDRGYNVTSLGGKYQRDIGETGRLTFQHIRNDAEVDFARAHDDFRTVNDRDEDILIGKWDQFLTDSFGYFIKGYYHRWDTEYTRLYNTDEEDQLSVQNDRDEWGFEDYGINLMGRYFFDGGSELVFGGEWQAYSGEDEVLLIETKTEHVGAIFGQYRPFLDFAPNTDLALGARYNKASLGGENLIWNFSARHNFANNQYVRGTVGTAFALPDAYQLYAIDPDHPQGNEDLDGEESLYADVGWGGVIPWTGGAFNWEVTAFGREIRDLIKLDTVNGVSTFVNSDDKVRMHGGELILGLQFARGWHTHVSATYAEATEKGSNDQIDSIPEYFAKAGINYRQPDGRYGLGLNAIYVGPTFQTLSDVGREEYGDHVVLDLTGYYALRGNPDHRIGFRLENITDEEYASTLSRGVRDDDTPYRVDNLGTPRNLQVNYTYRF